VSGVTVVTQKPPVLTATKGEKITMHCNLGTDNRVRWYKQVPGGVPQYVLNNYHSFSSPYYGSGFSSPKFTSTHSSQSDYTLIISNVEAGDSAVYYCQTHDGSARVSSQKVLTQTPSVQTHRSKTVTMDCNIAKYTGNYVSWYKQIPQAPYLSSCCSLYIDEICLIMTVFKMMLMFMNSNVALCFRDFPLTTPALSLLPPSPEELQQGSATLLCLAEELTVPLVQVSWTVNGTSVTDGVYTSPPVQQPDKTLKVSSSMTISASMWNSNVDFMCEVSVGSKASKKTVKQSSCF
ncbi:hypothetical protein NFI96_032146, partial [Prochilodus magdalenae]